MATTIWKLCNINLNVNISNSLCGSVRAGHRLYGKPPHMTKSLEQHLAETNYKDPAIYYRVDIGLPPPKVSKSAQLAERIKVLKAQRNPELEKLSRHKKLLIDLDKANAVWLKTAGPQHIKQIADHYDVFKHLYGDAYFYPQVPMNITYDNGDLQHSVYFGNVIKPVEAARKPVVEFESDDKSFWCLVLTNPDGHFTKPESEYVHWFIGNIPGNKVEKGECILEYLQPFPPKGTGFHRHIFVLYKQEKKLDFSQFKKPGSCFNLADRTFNTYDFYKSRQDVLTPAGLAFFQSDWDPTLKNFYHHKLQMQEPFFEYDFPPPYIRKQEWFALRKPFNLYMDRYRDPKQIRKEFLVRKLKKVHPFKAPEAPLPFPSAQYFNGYVPSWLQWEIQKSRMKWGRVNEIE